VRMPYRILCKGVNREDVKASPNLASGIFCYVPLHKIRYGIAVPSIEICCCYAHEDEILLNKLKSHLRPLQRQGFIEVWHDRDISAGTEWEREISQHLNSAQIILLLVSPDFMNSDYCYSVEMKRAMERHEQGEARVIPIIIRPVYWTGAPFGKLQPLPTDAKPVTTWSNSDEAFFNIVVEIQKILIEFQKEINLQSKRPRYQPQRSQTYERQPSDITSKHESNFWSFLSLSNAVKSTFNLSEKHVVRCEVKSYLIDRKKIIISVDGNEIYSRVFDRVDLHYDKQIHLFKIEDTNCICRIVSIDEISINVGEQEILRFTY